MVIAKLKDTEIVPYALLYLADESEEAVNDYLKRGECYVGKSGDVVVGVYVLLPTRPFTVELVNLAVAEEFQRRGYGKMLVEHAIRIASSQGYGVLEVGTGNSGISQLALYQKCGFSICGVDLDFFRKHYKNPIWENGIECRHMVRMRMELI